MNTPEMIPAKSGILTQPLSGWWMGAAAPSTAADGLLFGRFSLRKATLSHAKNNANTTVFTRSQCGHNVNVQPKGTPLRKPKNRGGSPSGVNKPPKLLTM